MIQKIAVEGNVVLCFAGLYPVGHTFRGAVAFLEEQNIAGDFRSGVGLERVVRQTDRAEQVRLLRQRFPDAGIRFVQRPLGRDKRHNSSGSNLIQCFGEEIIMDQQILTVIAFVLNFIFAERHVAYGKVEEIVRETGFLVTVHSDVGVLVKLFGDASRETVQLHAVQFRA